MVLGGPFLVPDEGRALAFFRGKRQALLAFFKEAYCWFPSGLHKFNHFSLVGYLRGIQSTFKI